MEDKKKKEKVNKKVKKLKKLYYGDKKEVAAAQKYFRDLSTPLAPSTMTKPITLKNK